MRFRLRSMGLPAGVGAAHVWIKQGAAEFSHVGTLASASSRFAMKMEVPQVRIAILPCAGAGARACRRRRRSWARRRLASRRCWRSRWR